MQFSEDVLGQRLIHVDLPNINSIAKDANEIDIIKFLELILFLAVHCEDRKNHISTIMSLPGNTQQVIMNLIQNVHTDLPNQVLTCHSLIKDCNMKIPEGNLKNKCLVETSQSSYPETLKLAQEAQELKQSLDTMRHKNVDLQLKHVS